MTKSRHFMAWALAAMLAMPTTAWADQPVVTVNGTQVEKTLTKMTFSGDQVMLHFADGTTDNVEDMTTVTVSMTTVTAIDRVKTFATHQLIGNTLTVGGISAGDRVALYDAAGQLRMQTTAAGNETTLSLGSLKTGIYIVKAGNNIIKFRKK